MNRFLYTLVRFVPDAASGEFVNIGAIAGSDEAGNWAMRAVSNQRRAAAIATGGDKKVLAHVMEQTSEMQWDVIEAQNALDAGEEPHLSEGWLHHLHATHHRILQFSEPTPLVASSAEEALDLIFEELVTDPGRQKRAARGKAAAFSVLYQAYRSAGLTQARAIRQRPTVRAAKHHVRFDFAVANGKAVQLANTWSFEAPSDPERLVDEVKAWAWAVQDLRRSGGSIRLGDSTLEVPRGVDIEVVYLPPIDPAGKEALSEALAAFEDENVHATVRSEADVADVAARASAELATAH